MAAAIPYILIAASSALSYSSSMQASKTAQTTGELNAQLDEQQATVNIQQSQADANIIRERNRRLQATQRVGFLKSGLTLDGGTPVDVMYDTSIQGELDALNVLYKGQVAAGFSNKSAALSRYDAGSRAQAYRYEGYGALLGGAGKALSVSASASNPSFRSTPIT